MSSPDPHDFLAVDAQLTDTERDIRDTVRAFARDELAPHIAQWYEAGTLPRDLVPRLGALGLLGMPLTGYGCAGTGAVAYGIACRELEAIDSGLRSLVSVQGSLTMDAVHRWGSEQQRQQWLPALAAGSAVGCFGLTEPDAGSDPSSMRTRARRDGDDWVLDGTKTWITNGATADVAVIWARTDDGVRGFLVPTDTPGFTAHEIGRKLSLRASVTAELVCDGVRLPHEAMLPLARGLRAPLACLSEARLGITFGTVGAARACYETALTYSTAREQFGRPIAGFQMTQRKLADMLVDVNQAGLLALHLGRLKEADALYPQQVSMGKMTNAAAALRVARTARTVLGASGVTLDYPVLRHAANLETVLTYEGTEEVHALTLGQAITGVSAFR